MEAVCPHCMNRCRFSIALDPGQVILCPACRRPFDFPGHRPIMAPPPLPAATKPCPFCAETIQAEARKCRYCGEILDPVLRSIREETRATRQPNLGGGVAAVLSLFLPGAGQIYCGRVAIGVGWLFLTVFGYMFFFVVGLILHLCCILDAGSGEVRR